MTQKDFKELAAQLAIVKADIRVNIKSHDDRTAAFKVWSDCVFAVMLACKSTSANFDRGKFLTACGVPNIGIK